MTLPGIKNVDHVGFTVPNMDEAVKFFTEVLGSKKIYEIGPFEPNGDWMSTYLDVEDSTRVPRVVILENISGANFELFEYEAENQNKKRPRNSDIGGHHLAFYVEDIQKAYQYLIDNNIEVLGEPTYTGRGYECW